MSEESNAVVLSTEKDENLENDTMKDNDPKPDLHSDESPFTENTEVSTDKVQAQESKPVEPAQPEEANRPALGSLKSNVEVADPGPEKQLSTSDASTEVKSLERAVDSNQSAVDSTTSEGSTETKSLEMIDDCNQPAVESTTSDGSTDIKSSEKTSGNEPSEKSTESDESTLTPPGSLERATTVDQPDAKSTTSSEISPSKAPTSDKGLEEVTENIKSIYKGLKEMKISAEEIAVSASGKKGRKPPTTPRARSTPALTSPPLTRSRSRDLRKFPSTPSSPKHSSTKKTSEGDSDEMKARGRQRAKKNN